MATHSSILDWRIPMDRGAWLGIFRIIPSCASYAVAMGFLRLPTQQQQSFITQSYSKAPVADTDGGPSKDSF